MSRDAGTRLKKSLNSPEVTILPGAYSPVIATMLEQLGFEGMFMPGSQTNIYEFGMPDIGLMSMREMVDADNALAGNPNALARANKRFHKQIHLASHNRYLVQQLDLVHRSMALMATSSLAVEGRGEIAQAEHNRIVEMIEARDEDGADEALRTHISVAFMTRLKQEAARREEDF